MSCQQIHKQSLPPIFFYQNKHLVAVKTPANQLFLFEIKCAEIRQMPNNIPKTNFLIIRLTNTKWMIIYSCIMQFSYRLIMGSYCRHAGDIIIAPKQLDK